MKSSNRFTKTTGSIPRLAFTDCECHNYGRPWCFGCIVEEQDYKERQQPIETETKPPRFKRHDLTLSDQRFLDGIPERIFKPKKHWKNNASRRYYEKNS